MNLRSVTGKALYRLPEGTRALLPRAWRDAVRRRIGPFAPWEAGFVHSPPVARTGEVTGPPDFVGIGAQKAGTTWWFGLLLAHPGVSHHEDIHKERHFFGPFATDAFGPAQVSTYHAWFPRAMGTITGEWTPDYSYQPWVPPLMAIAAPSAKLLMMVRDPVERFLSGLAHSGIRPSAVLGDQVAEAIARGFYGAALSSWLQHFEPDQLLVLQYEICVEQPVEQLKRTYRFLHLADDFVPPDISARWNQTQRDKVSLDPDARRRLVDIYKSDVAELARLFPQLDLSHWPNFKDR